MHCGGEGVTRRVVRVLADWEWLLVGLMAPLLLFPTRWSAWGAAGIGVLTLCRWAATGRLGLGAAVDVPALLVLGMGFVGWYVSPDRLLSVAGWWRLLLGVALLYAVAAAVRRERGRRWLAAAIIGAGLAMALLTLLGTGWERVRLLSLPGVYGLLPGWLRDVQDQNPFHPRVMGMALGAWLPLPLALGWLGRGRSVRSGAGVAVVVMGLTLLLTQSLQAAVGVAAAVLILGVCWSRWFLVSVPVLLAGGLWALWSYGWQRAVLAALAVGDRLGIAASLRLDMWSRALAMISDRPYTGIGLDAYALMQWHFYPGVMLGSEPHAHNLFLQAALDLGLPGLLALLWLLCAVVNRVAHRLRENAGAVERAVLLGVVAAVVSCLTAGLLDTMWASKAAVVLWVVLGVGAGAGIEETGFRRQDSGERMQAAGGTGKGNGLQPCFLAFPLMMVLILPGLLMPRGAWALNEILVRGHRVLLAAQRGEPVVRQELVAVRGNLRFVIRGGVERASIYSLLGQAEGWLGREEEAIDALRRRVLLDGVNPLASYAPFEALRRQVAGEPSRDRWEDLAWVYGHWVSRFPQRAEAYALLANVRQRQGRAEEAARVLEEARRRGAEPRAMLGSE